MSNRVTKYLILGLVAMLLLSSVAMIAPAGSREEYTMSKTDPSGDPEGIVGFDDQQTKDDADILEITSALSGENIVLTMKVTGTIRLNGTSVVGIYEWFIDINGDGAHDWLAGAFFYENTGGTNAQLQEDEATATSWQILYYLDNATGDGTDTVSIQFPLTNITENENTTAWNIYGKAGVVKDSIYSYEDFAPQEGFSDGGGGNDTDPDDVDGDGMPNDWEDEYGLNKSDPSDAGADNDDDGYTNLQEYEADTDPLDANDPPQDVPDNGDGDDDDPSDDTPTDTEIDVKIDSVRHKVERKDGNITYDILVRGTTSGVDHAKFGFTYVFKDGSKDFTDWMEPIDYMKDPSMKKFFEDQGFTEYHFKSTSNGDWETWEFRMAGEVEDETDDTDGNDTEDEPDKVIFYVRAFSDADETKWNQASKEKSFKASDKKDDDDGGLPGFEALFAIAALAFVMIVARVTWRKNK